MAQLSCGTKVYCSCGPLECCQTIPMCANAGSSLDNIFNDLGSLIKPFAPSINQAIAGKPQTVSGFLGTFSGSQLLIFGALAVLVIFMIDKHG